MARFVDRVVFGLAFTALCLLAAVSVWAQATVPSPPIPPSTVSAGVPDWVGRYAMSQEQARRTCDVALAQAETKVDELTKQLAEAKAALAKPPVAPPAPPK